MSAATHDKIEEADFTAEVSKATGVKFPECYQCGKCSAGCPSAFEMDLLPHQIVHAVQMNERTAALSAKSLWLCVGCQTCLDRCPNTIDLPATMDALREIAYNEGLSKGNREVEAFHKAFLFWVERTGRVFEGGMVGMFKARTFRLLKDLEKAPKMLKKMHFLPEFIRGHKAVGRLFNRAKKP